MKRKGIYSVMAFLLAAGLCLAKPVIGGAVEDADYLEKPCSVTVWAGDTQFREDLEKAQVVLDMYKVADAVEVQGGRGYVYELTAPYKNQEALKPIADQTDKDWRVLAQEATKITLAEGAGIDPYVKPADGTEPDGNGAGAGASAPYRAKNPGEKIEVDSGLYLLVARGNDLENYTKTIETEDGEKLVTMAQSPLYAYTFEPQLVSLPLGSVEGDGTTNILSGEGSWDYDVEITLKAEQNRRYGSLEIVKTLQSYETKEPAMFVFQIEAVLDGETVYSDVESIIFTEAGQEKILLENKIPAGAVVTVTEVYKGAAYSLETQADETQTRPIAADQISTVEFVNRYNDEQKGGHGIVNQFRYNETSGAWDWTPITE
ncbi:MAG: hypothetical protein HFI68_00730 [Lachnospiraceae bacterium]|nr:hypothetical protein [Lachnospiraceae bacterium]